MEHRPLKSFKGSMGEGFLQPPGFVTFRTNFRVKLFMGRFSGSRKPMDIVEIF